MRRALVCLMVLLGACGSNNAQDATIALSEFDVVADPASADAGEVTFSVTNSGEEVHELIVVKTELDPAELPTAEDGSFHEEDLDVIDEIEDIEAGGDRTLTVELDAGSYVLACNIVEEEEGGEREAHYAEGMYTSFTVS